MKKHFNILLTAVLLLVAGTLSGEEVTYRIAAYSNDAQDFTIQSWGEKPRGSIAYFESDYGSTYGNRYNQIPRNHQATLYLQGWDGCTIQSVTLAMCSNNKAGTCGLTVSADSVVLFKSNPVAFNDPSWYGEWLSKDLGVYGDITKEMTTQTSVPDDGLVSITLKAGTSEGSVYLDHITINYTPAPVEEPTESPLGYVFEKLEAKSTLSEGDVVMFYRSGNAAADIDGIETSHYLDAIGIDNTSNVVEPDVLCFTLHRDSTLTHWLFVDQYDRTLGATKAQSLAWDEGVLTWDITLGYSGATVASTNTKYGTMRYNAPSGSYPRFWNYTSTSLTLPYLYRRVRQLEPTISTSISIPAERTVELYEPDTVVVRTTIYPTSVTDRRLLWESSDTTIATVRDGIVHLLALGDVTITVKTVDGGASAQMLLHIIEHQEDGILSPLAVRADEKAYDLSGRPARGNARGIVIRQGKKVVESR